MGEPSVTRSTDDIVKPLLSWVAEAARLFPVLFTGNLPRHIDAAND